jgi:hypothetical protein
MHAGRRERNAWSTCANEMASGTTPVSAKRPSFGRLCLYDPDELLELGRIIAQRFAWPVKDDPATIHHEGARCDIEGKTRVLFDQDNR